jgi:hypothetical protein
MASILSYAIAPIFFPSNLGGIKYNDFFILFP